MTFPSLTRLSAHIAHSAVLTSNFALLVLGKCRRRYMVRSRKMSSADTCIGYVRSILILYLYFQVLTLEAEEGALCLAAVLVGDEPLVVCGKECILIGACSGILGCM